MAFAIRIVGYVQASPLHRNLNEQKKALRRAGCTELFVEDNSLARRYRNVGSMKGDASGKAGSTGRPVLDIMLNRLRSGDMVIVWRLDRLGRSFGELANILSELSAREIGFKSLCEKIDTTVEGGNLLVRIVTAVASFDSSDRSARHGRRRCAFSSCR